MERQREWRAKVDRQLVLVRHVNAGVNRASEHKALLFRRAITVVFTGNVSLSHPSTLSQSLSPLYSHLWARKVCVATALLLH